MKSVLETKLRLALFVALLVQTVYAKTYWVSNAEEMARLTLSSGDTVVLRNGSYNDQRFVLKAGGTRESPIVLRAETPGQVILRGNTSLSIDGSYLIVSGLLFTDGTGAKDVVRFTESSLYCRLTNTAIIDYSPGDKKTESRYVSLYGSHNRVDHCYFKGKTNLGPTVVVWLGESPNYHRIDHNHFGPRPLLGENGAESIRIGTSAVSMRNSYTTVEYNLFEHCDGETEIISNKSCRNTLRYNTFFESQGTLTLRHGNDAVVYGNFFIGNKVEKTGGVRIIGENHIVFGNHFQDLKGTGLRAAICIMNGIPDSPLNGYFQVKHAQVIDNTIVRCEEAISIGMGKSEKQKLTPQGVILAANHVVPGTAVLTWYDEVPGMQIENNLVYRADSTIAPPGFNTIDPKLCRNLPGMKNQHVATPPLVHQDVGCDWTVEKK